MYYRIAVFLLACFFSQAAYAQALKFSEAPEAFIAEAQALCGVAQQPKTGSDFNILWTSGRLSPDQQKRIVALSRAMAAKNMRQPYLLPLWEGIMAAVFDQNYTPTELDSFLEVSEKAFKNSDSKVFSGYLTFAKAFLSSRKLYSSNNYSIHTTGGKCTFVWNDNAVEITQTTPQAAKETEEPTDNGWSDNTWDEGSWNNPTPTQESPLAPTPERLGAGAALKLTGVSLALVTAQDSFVVSKATGILGIRESILLGQEGSYNWPTLEKASVAFSSFKINLKNPRFLAEKASLTFPEKLESPTEGIFRFESKKRNPTAPVIQPQFQSLSNTLTVKNIGKNVEYRGGFALIGNRLFSSAANGKLSSITVKQGGQVAFRSFSHRFELTDSLLTSPSASLVVYMTKRDSLSHPSVRLRYEPQTLSLKTLRVERGGYKNASYTDSYHGFEIRADMMRWHLPKQTIDFEIISGQEAVPVRLESLDFYDAERYSRLVSTQGFHPVTILSNFLRQKNQKSATVYDLAVFYKRDAKLIREAFVPAIEQGFILYDADNELLRLGRKANHYAEAVLGKRDFDNFAIRSLFGSTDSLVNARITFKDSLLTVRGVEPFRVSDSLKISMKPSDGILKIGRNRSLSFNGEMKLDNFRFKGQNLSFNYEKFYVNLDKMESVTFVPQQLRGKDNVKEIGEDLKYSTGKLYLGRADNKSGKVPSFPRLVVPDGVIVYFDDTTRLAGAYERKKVYFKIPKIDQDSLTNKDIDFVGTFYSNGILPPIQTRLMTMPDNSLGFSYKAPPEGLKIYDNKADLKLSGVLKMDNKGLHAEGTLNYLTASLVSNNFVLTPDSVVTETGTSGAIKEGTLGTAYFPEVAFKGFTMRWLPKKDSLIVQDKGSALDFYAGSSRLVGRLVVRSSGLFGEGTMKRKDSEVNSRRFQFNKDQFLAQRADIRVGGSQKPFLLGRTMDVTFNLAAGNTLIEIPKNNQEEDSSSLFFPYAAYRTSINRAVWDLNAKTITMKGDVRTSNFTATHPDREGLQFNGSEAIYEIERMLLTIKGVPFIPSADAKIFPNGGTVSIRQDGEMPKLAKAKIIVDSLNEYHRLTNGNIRIISAKQFEGDAVYQFVRAAGDTAKIKMDAFEFKEVTASTASTPARGRNPRKVVKNLPEKTYSTIAKATILDTDKFFLSPRLQFKGEVTMLAPEEGLRFKGFVSTVLKSKLAPPGWIPFSGNNADSVRILVDEKLKGEGEPPTPLTAGLHYDDAGSGLYLTFLSQKEDPRDQDVFLAKGTVRDNTNQIEITPDTKANGLTLEGSQTILDDARRVLTYEGPLALFYPTSAVSGAGYARIVPDSNKFIFNTLLTLNAPLPPTALAVAGDRIVKVNLDEKLSEEAAEEDFDRLLSKIANTAGQKVAEAFRAKSSGGANVPLYTISPMYATTAVLSNVSLRYSPENGSYFSIGKLGLSNIGSTDINGQFNGVVEIRKGQQREDDLFLYLEPTPEMWFYFAYVQGEWGVASSEPEFNNQLSTKVGKEKGMKFRVIDEYDKTAFLDRFNLLYRPKPKIKPAPAKQSTTSKPATVSTQEKKDEPKQPETIAKPTAKPALKDSTKIKPAIVFSEPEPVTPTKKPAEKKTGF